MVNNVTYYDNGTTALKFFNFKEEATTTVGDANNTWMPNVTMQI